MNLLVSLLVILIVVGILTWIVTLMPLPSPFKQAALAVVGLICLLLVLNTFGFLGLGHQFVINR